MTSAVATPSTDPRPTQTVPIVILGTDALLAAQPATPVQLAHACLRAGFAHAVPASWGDELIAAAVLRRLPQFEGGPAIQCSCPIVAHRLLSVGGDLRPAMLGFVSPPVAIARYVRTLCGDTPVRITYVGACPGANDEAIDIRMRPDSLLALLAERNIVVQDQPRVFESVLPPDRRRFRSQPGGVPTTESLWTEAGARTLIEVDGDDFVTELAQQLLTGRNVLIDAAPHLGCVCSGAVDGVSAKDARACVVALEPPRATLPVVEEEAPIDLELAVPAAPRAPVDVSAGLAYSAAARGMTVPAPSPGPAPTAMIVSNPPLAGHRFSPVRGLPAIPDPKPHRPSGPGNQRSVLGTAPVARDIEGKSLPRAYVARRRPSPRAVAAVAPASSPAPKTSRSARGAARVAVEAVEAVRPATESTIGLPIAAPPSPRPEAPALFDRQASAERDSQPALLSAIEAEKPRPAPRARPAVTPVRERRAGVSTQRLIVLGVAAVVLSVLLSVISAVVVARVVRSSAAASTTQPPASMKP